MTYHLHTPFPPTVNTYYRRAGNHIHISAKGKEFKKQVIAYLEREKLRDECLMGRLKVRIRIVPPNRRKFDLDNRLKALLDSLQAGGLFVDDEQIDSLTIDRKHGQVDEGKKGYALIVVECLDN